VNTLTAVLAHLDAELTDERMTLLGSVAPDSRFLLCYGGSRAEFDRLGFEPKAFIDDPSLRGPLQHLQSMTAIFELVWHQYLAAEPGLAAAYFIEYDHLIFSSGFEATLADLAARTEADLLGKNCVDRTGTNDEHYVRFRRDPKLEAHLRRLSVRDADLRLFGCLGDGMWLSRRALQAYVEVAEHPPCYCEIYVPTLLHHLGLRVVNVDAHSDIYRNVRWMPPFDAREVVQRVEAGSVFMHPVKDREAVRAAAEALSARRRLSSPVG
jgi:hypothetical protein